MENIFKHLQYSIIEQAHNSSLKLSLIVISNKDKTPRWIMKSSAKEAYFLKFYHQGNLRAKLFSWTVKFIFLLRLQKLFFKTIEIIVESSCDGPLFDLKNDNWAIHTGTPGPNNKMLLYSEAEENPKFFKIATTIRSTDLMLNEINSINRLYALNPSNFYVPNINFNSSKTILEMEDVSIFGKRESVLDKAHFSFLSELYEKTSFQITFNELQDTFRLSITLDEINDKRIPNGLIRKLKKLIDNVDESKIEVAMNHGDFTPWNCYKAFDMLAIYDWELSSPLLPIGFDAFHFIIQKGILVDRKSWKAIKQEIENTLTNEKVCDWFKFEGGKIEKYLTYYLITNTIAQLKLYSSQSIWHDQINWLLETWDQAISDILSEVTCTRELVIVDLFNLLNRKNYAAIKFHNEAPEKLSEYADIDLCIAKQDALKAIKFLRDHPSVLHIQSSYKTFMCTTKVVLKNGKLLSIDWIWQIKRKSIIMMDLTDILRSTYTNEYGIKMMDLMQQARYIGLFYGLNNQEIPAKYLAYEQIIKESASKIDRILYSSYIDHTIDKMLLVKELKKTKENKRLNALKNKIIYLIDCLLQFSSRKGFIITFSGVDGAGKSTVIEKIKFEIEKKLRKQVIILRHRPSILPILSVLKKGKVAVKAEQESISKLPRQGSNKSLISSYIRFFYYLCDYILGQFYIYLKYTSRGIIVVYDRYYFDFIVDSKRSNIQISPRLAKFFYSFILKPDLNFFLFADSKTILKRKQELDKETILELTEKYNQLFKQLNSKNKGSLNQYVTIENNDLQATLDVIFSSTIPLAA